METTLTLKAADLKFYIGCPCYILGSDKPVLSVIKGVDVVSDTVTAGVNRHEFLVGTSVVKPILRKPENLSRHEIEQLNKLWPKESIKRTFNDSIMLDAHIISYLTSINVDVFGWIEQGLAVDAEYNSI